MHLFLAKKGFFDCKRKLIKEGSGIAGLIMPHAIFGYVFELFCINDVPIPITN